MTRQDIDEAISVGESVRDAVLSNIHEIESDPRFRYEHDLDTFIRWAMERQYLQIVDKKLADLRGKRDGISA